ncbi:MAG: hypothetical protein ACI8UO_003599 [Verrucomicrobiales bacterium]|jgi:hypothetical protein
MTRLKIFGLIGILALFGAGAWTRFAPAKMGGIATNQSRLSFKEDIEPILIRYCFDCHGDGMDKGDVALDTFENSEQLLGAFELWQGVHHNMEGRLMPPSDKPQPSDEDHAKLTAWIEREVFKLDPDKPDPGRVTIRRLNREEYRNSIRDLIGDVGFDPSSDLPADDTGYGFDNIGDVLSMSPGLLEKYVMAADRVVSAAIKTEPPAPERIKVESSDFRGLKHADHGTGRLSSSGTVGALVKLPRDGEYEIRVIAGADQAGDELAKMQVKIPGAKDKIFDIKAATQQPEYCEQVLKMKAGEAWIEMSFINDFYDPKNKNPNRRDRNLAIHRVEVTGPLNEPLPPPSEMQKAIFAAAPDDAPDREKARHVVRTFAGRAWRRPVQPEELDRLMKFVDLVIEEGEIYEAGVKLALNAVLVSPNFLFRGEAQSDPGDRDQIRKIDEHALATRLSYFLWSSTPDEQLLRLAERGELRKNLDSQVERMLADPKIEALTRNFAGQWLQLRNLDLASPDPKTYKNWNDDLRHSMRGETERFFAALVNENRSILELLDADFTFLNEQLAKHYGIDGVKGAEFQRVSLTSAQRERRGGVLTHASVLTITSNPTRTSPVNRGAWVLENILGTPPPPPVEDVPDLEESRKKAGKDVSMRQQLELHREKAICASCHKRMDPIGFGLENYDGIGAWRDKESGQPIDSSGELYTGEKFSSGAELRRILVEHKQQAFSHALAEAMLTYALGRGVEYYDKPALNAICKKVEARGYRFQSLIREIVDSVPFQYRRGESGS